MTGLSDQVLVLTLSDAPPPRLDKALAQVVPEDVTLSRSRLAKLIEEGAVAHADGTVVTVLKTKGQPGEEFHITIPEVQDYDAQPEDIALQVLFEDARLIVINKPAGMVVHPAPGSEAGTLVNALLHHCGDTLSGISGEKRPGIVHRIDKDTSGVLVVAKSDAAHQGLAKQFKDHSIDRRYLAFANGVPSKGDPRLAGIKGVSFEDGGVLRIATNIARHKTDRKRMAVTAHEGRHAITRVRVLEAFGGSRASLVECQLETGRTHQIRVHMGHIGHGLIGDPVYGRKKRIGLQSLDAQDAAFVSDFPRQALHAASLGFVHPVTGESLYFEAEMPKDMRDLYEILRKIPD